MLSLLLTIVLAPLAAAVLAGLFGRTIGRAGAHSVTILGVAVAFACSALVLYRMLAEGAPTFNETLYTWLVTDGIRFEVGFLVDHLTALMMVVVTFVSLMVHVYTIGYMHEDDGYQRFFSYISLFTFAMLMLVMSNNYLQLFFGWEAVGLVSYLLIGFWYTKSSAIFANMKAFLVNRVGDFGFVLGIAAIVYYTGSLRYADAFAAAPVIATHAIAPWAGTSWNAMTVVCICLFIGAMGKSAQVPLHVWLPDSMEGPTPISALIHAATMVTAGIFMVARMSPLFELSPTARSFVLVIGATTALFMGFLGIIQNDIKRVVAYSTLSQLGYMTVALGVSAYSVAIFHLMTHAFFKALLFLAAGSVIIGMHHEQDMRKMGGLRRYMPVTYITSMIGSLALIGFPGFAGFYSKDSIIESVHAALEGGQVAGAGYAYFCVVVGVFVTAFYSFRMVFMTFHGEERMDHHTKEHLHESPLVVTLPLVALAVPSVLIGAVTMGPVLFEGYFGSAIQVLPANDVVAKLGAEWHGPIEFILEGLRGPTVWIALAGVAAAWYLYLANPALPARLGETFAPLYRLLDRKYYFDWFNENVLAAGSRRLGTGFWKAGDQFLIDGALVNGSARTVGVIGALVRHLQTGLLYHYAFAMIIGLSALLAYILYRA
jgi:NADH-quinone oxidoreductase subunit L